MQTIDSLWHTVHSVEEWIRFADAKAGAALAADGLIVAVLAQTVFNDPASREWLVLFAGGVSVALAAASGMLALVSVVPRTAFVPPGSTLYWAHIAAVADATAFESEIRGVCGDPEKMEASLATLIWGYSRLARRKYRLVHWALRFLIAAVVIGGLVLLAAG